MPIGAKFVDRPKVSNAIIIIIIVIIIIIIKYIYIAQCRAMLQSAEWTLDSYTLKQQCLFVSEHDQQTLRCSQFSIKTVPDLRSLNNEATVAVVCSGYRLRGTVSRAE